MTTIHVNQRFEDVRAIGQGHTIEDIELDQCTFIASAATQWDDLSPSLVFRRISATRCTLDNCVVVGARFEDVIIDHLAIKGGMLQLNGCVFSHVKLTGRIGPVMAVSPMAKLGEQLPQDAEQVIVDAYRSIDWALDISEAEFTNAGFYHVPGELIRRDPETQFLLRREKLVDLDRRTLPEGSRVFLSRFNTTPYDAIVAVAPRRSRQFRSRLEILQRLRDMGIAE